MKTISKIAAIAILVLSLSIGVWAQSPPPPNSDGNGPTSENTEVGGDGGSAPIGGGIAMLMAMGAAYGGKKYYDYRKKLQNEMED